MQNRQNKKIKAMTPEEYRAYRDKENARAREYYMKRKSGQRKDRKE